MTTSTKLRRLDRCGGLLLAMKLKLSRKGRPETSTPNLLFLCRQYQSVLPGWHRLASGPGEAPHGHQSFSIT